MDKKKNCLSLKIFPKFHFLTIPVSPEITEHKKKKEFHSFQPLFNRAIESCQSSWSVVLRILLRIEHIVITARPTDRFFLPLSEQRRIAVKKWCARYQQLTHPLIRSQTMKLLFVLCTLWEASRAAWCTESYHRPLSRRVSQFVDGPQSCFTGIWWNLLVSFGQYDFAA